MLLIVVEVIGYVIGSTLCWFVSLKFVCFVFFSYFPSPSSRGSHCCWLADLGRCMPTLNFYFASCSGDKHLFPASLDGAFASCFQTMGTTQECLWTFYFYPVLAYLSDFGFSSLECFFHFSLIRLLVGNLIGRSFVFFYIDNRCWFLNNV